MIIIIKDLFNNNIITNNIFGTSYNKNNKNNIGNFENEHCNHIVACTKV